MEKNAKIKELTAKKKLLIHKIKERNDMTPEDVIKLRNFDYNIYMEKHPKLKKFHNWLYPKLTKKDDWKKKLKRVAKRLAIFPVTICYDLSLRLASNYWENMNIKKHAPNEENKLKLFTLGTVIGYGLEASALPETLFNTSSKTPKPPLDSALQAKLSGRGPQPPVTRQPRTCNRVNVLTNQSKGNEL